MDFQTPWFDFRLTGLADGWTCDYTCRREAEEICIAGFHFRNVQPGRLPACRLEFRVPWRDMQIKWMPRRNMADCHHFFPGWWNGGKFPYAVTHNQLLYVFANEAGQNRLAFACSECCRAVLATCGVSGEYIECELFFNTTASDPAVEFSFEVKIDRRKLAYDCVLADLAEWQTRQYAPAPVPESAFLPVYSTWYQFQKEVSQAELEKELPEAAAAMTCPLRGNGCRNRGNFPTLRLFQNAAGSMASDAFSGLVCRSSGKNAPPFTRNSGESTCSKTIRLPFSIRASRKSGGTSSRPAGDWFRITGWRG